MEATSLHLRICRKYQTQVNGSETTYLTVMPILISNANHSYVLGC